VYSDNIGSLFGSLYNCPVNRSGFEARTLKTIVQDASDAASGDQLSLMPQFLVKKHILHLIIKP
jgi:hypothetical protein